MEKTFFNIKSAMAAFFAALGALLGWKGIMALAWVLLMAADWITGTWAARKNGTWKSSISRDGAWHKAGSIIVIALAFAADFIIGVMVPHIPVLNIQWPDLLAPLVLAWYIVTELGSILENAIKLGAPVPKWLVAIFDATLNMVENIGSEVQQAMQEQAAADQTPQDTGGQE